ncbi:MAG: DNA polymerase III subunit gamma/tau [Brevinematia bacterium]
MSLPTARRWRPQNYDEVVGQDEVVKALKSAMSLGRIGQAYLFSGPRGVGKTTISRILAKSLNCVHGPTPTPCNSCENCVEIRNGTSADVIEIDGASNRKIEDVRSIREAVKFTPIKSRYKIYIIDEVHMLTDEAFNALLKTLEEPPPHVVFIFATTEPYKVKQTIRSRCQHFVLKPLSVDNIFKQLKKISEAEGYKLTDGALMKIAKAGNGSMRDAESMFDMVISYFGNDVYDEKKMKQIAEEELSKILGVIDIHYMESTLTALSERNITELVRIVNSVYSKGFDLRKFVEELIACFRNLLIMKEFGTDRSLIRALDDEIKVLEKVKDSFSKDEIIFIENALIRAYLDMRSSINELFHLENALFRIVNPDNVITLSKLLNEVRELKMSMDASKQISVTATGEGQSALQAKTQEDAKLKVKLDPADDLIDELDRMTLPPEELVKQIVAENSLPGVEKKIKVVFSGERSLVELTMDKSVREILEKDVDKIVSKIKSSLNVRDVRILTTEQVSRPSSLSTRRSKESRAEGLGTVEEKLSLLFDAKEVKDFNK